MDSRKEIKQRIERNKADLEEVWSLLQTQKKELEKMNDLINETAHRFFEVSKNFKWHELSKEQRDLINILELYEDPDLGEILYD